MIIFRSLRTSNALSETRLPHKLIPNSSKQLFLYIFNVSQFQNKVFGALNPILQLLNSKSIGRKMISYFKKPSRSDNISIRAIYNMLYVALQYIFKKGFSEPWEQSVSCPLHRPRALETPLIEMCTLPLHHCTRTASHQVLK